MKKVLLSIISCLTFGFGYAQTYPYVDINQISFVSPTDLANCNDSSAYLGDTVRTRAIVITDGSLSEVASSSITGGSRPFISVIDTAYDGVAPQGFQSAVVMGAFGNTPVTDIENAIAGDILDMTVLVAEFNGLVQLTPISATSVSLVGVAPSIPTFVTINAGDIQDNQRRNILTTGEQWEGAYVELQNVTVTSVSVFSGGSRCEFTVADASGNQVLVADRFLPMRVNGVATVNPNSPATLGTLVPPTVGTVYNHIRGIIFQDENGSCYPNASNFAGGYEINPFDSTDIDKAASPASISNINRTPLVPNATQTVTVSADIIDNDGIVTGATLYYTADQTAPANLFSSITMTNVNSLYSATIPAFPLDSVVRYYIEATDDSSNVTTSPSTPMGQRLKTYFYTVRPNGPTIMDIQKVLDLSEDESPLVGDTVTVTGIVTASYQTGDLGYLYIQDPSANEFAGIFVEGGPTSVFTLSRGDEVTIQGVVAEQFGFTKLQAITATATSNTGTITPIEFSPNDTAAFRINPDTAETYEGMLVRLKNPSSTGRVWVNNANLGFGEYRVSTDPSLTVGSRILAGRQQGTQAQSSLDVSYISDTAAYGANLNVTPVQVTTAMSFDHIEGLVYYSFGNHKITPRNNVDFPNLIVSIEEISSSNVELNIYPNPTADRVNIKIAEEYNFETLNIQMVDMNGRVVAEMNSNLHLSSLNLDGLENGFYIIKVINENEILNTSKVIINK